MRFDLIAIHLELQCAARDPELLRGAGLIPVGALEGLENQVALEAPDRFLEAE